MSSEKIITNSINIQKIERGCYNSFMEIKGYLISKLKRDVSNGEVLERLVKRANINELDKPV